MTPDIADIIAGELGVSRGTAYDMMREVLAEEFPPDPCCFPGTSCNAPKPWVGLTDEEIEACDCLHVLWTGDDDQELVGTKDFARAIETKLREKNT